MKLPEPVGVITGKLGEHCSFKCNVLRKGDGVYSETQLRAEIERRDAVLREVLEAFSEVAAWESSGDQFHPASKAIKAIQEVLG